MLVYSSFYKNRHSAAVLLPLNPSIVSQRQWTRARICEFIPIISSKLDTSKGSFDIFLKNLSHLTFLTQFLSYPYKFPTLFVRIPKRKQNNFKRLNCLLLLTLLHTYKILKQLKTKKKKTQQTNELQHK